MQIEGFCLGGNGMNDQKAGRYFLGGTGRPLYCILKQGFAQSFALPFFING
jgi:hypothetical protein